MISLLLQVFSETDAKYAGSVGPINSTEYSLCSFHGWYIDTSKIRDGIGTQVDIPPAQCYRNTSLAGKILNIIMY